MLMFLLAVGATLRRLKSQNPFQGVWQKTLAAFWKRLAQPVFSHSVTVVACSFPHRSSFLTQHHRSGKATVAVKGHSLRCIKQSSEALRTQACF